jgi:hypothetical protein
MFFFYCRTLAYLDPAGSHDSVETGYNPDPVYLRLYFLVFF